MVLFETLIFLPLQKLIFLDTAEGVATTIRPYWSEATKDRANVVQAIPDMLEIVPPGTSKGSGVKMLLDHLGISTKEVRLNIVFLHLLPLFFLFVLYFRVNLIIHW